MKTPPGYSRRQLAALAGIVALGSAATIALRRSRLPGVDIGDEPIAARVLGETRSPRWALAGSDVNVAVFTDYRCPVCRSSDAALMSAARRDGHVTILFKEWPIFGDASRRAAIAALAAARQDLYVPIRKALLAAPDLSLNRMERIVELAGGAWSPIADEVTSPGEAISAILRRVQEEALALGLAGTPAYLIGPVLVEGALSESELVDLFARVREG
ncbi:MAG: thioredoxin domain-containing protein [Erythrobacter sp.]